MEDRLDLLARIMQTGFDTLADLQRETNGRLDTLAERVDVLTGRVDVLTKRFDNFLSGAHHEDHAELRRRVSRIERHLDLPETP